MLILLILDKRRKDRCKILEIKTFCVFILNFTITIILPIQKDISYIYYFILLNIFS